MRLDEEAQNTEESIRNARRIEEVPALKEILQEALTNFEEALKTLSPDDRERTLGLYLDKIRRITFGFHLAVLKQNAKRDARKGSESSEALRGALEHYGEELQRIGRLYRLL
jgi:hypothetical protein